MSKDKNNLKEKFSKAGERSALNIARVRLSCFEEVWQKWCELDEQEFDKWLHSKLHEA
jgi:hypothetical protein